MRRLIELSRTSVGRKAVVAVTGVILFGFVVMHMIGNLKTFLGSDAEGVPHVDVYAHFLRTMGEPMVPYETVLWIVRIVLVVALVLHVVAVIQLARHNRNARPIAYTKQVYATTTISARSMFVTGSLLLGFLVFHILQFTTGTIQVTPVVEGTVYANLYWAFHQWFFVLLYVGAMAMLGMHLYHGAWSLFQTLGLDNPDRNACLRLFAAVAAIGVAVGFCSVPVLIFFGVLPVPPETLTQPLTGG